MDLKQAILQGLDVGQARWYVESLGIPCEVGAPRDRVIAALAGSPKATAHALLDPLYEADVKEVCRRLGVSSVGRRKVLVSRLLADPPAEPAATGADDRPAGQTFVAVDFETADYGQDSACAVALVRVEDGRIAQKTVRLVRPPRRDFVFTYVHGLTWRDVQDQPTFAELWPTLAPVLEGASFLAAHNAPFDRGVMEACCRAARLPAPRLPFRCTVQIARKAWKLFPTKLPNVCRHLGIPLDHHEAGSDAEACARIVIAAGADRPVC